MMMMMLPMMMMLMPMLCAVNGYMLPRLNHHPFALLATRGDKYPISRNYYEESLKRLNSYNGTMRDLELLGMAGSWIEKTGESIIIIHHREVTTNHTDGDDGGDDGDDDGGDDSDDDAKEKRRDQEKKNHTLTNCSSNLSTAVIAAKNWLNIVAKLRAVVQSSTFFQAHQILLCASTCGATK